MNHQYFVSPEWLEAHLDDPLVRIIDATIFFDIDNEEMLKTGQAQYENHHIPGALEANLFDLSEPNAKLPFTVPAVEQLITAFEGMGISDDTHVVIYDSGPQVGVDFSAAIWAARLAWLMLYAGLEKVSILEGGFDLWLAENRPLSKEIKTYPAGKLTCQARFDYLVHKKDVRVAIDQESTLIIDALSVDQFEGRIAPYGPERAGHIPSSVNLFHGLFSDGKTGLVYDKERLLEIFNQVQGFDTAKKIIVYCGFGVSAAWLFVLLKHLGKDNIALYDGSLDEWTADPTCPLTL